MTFTYRLVEDEGTFVAECLESDAQGEGKTHGEAVSSLRQALTERMFRPDAVAPPEETTACAIELVPAEGGAQEPTASSSRA